MSYLRLDAISYNPSVSMMAADGSFKQSIPHPTSNWTVPSVQPFQSSYPSHSYPSYPTQPTRPTQSIPAPPAPPQLPPISGLAGLIRLIGYPDITDTAKGGIAIWSRTTLYARGYKFLHRVEIIDESVPSYHPVKHFSNVYIWVNIPLSDAMIDNVNQMSTDIFYDRGKELLIVRSESLDTAVAQASLVGLYSKGKVSYYDIMCNDMLERYYTSISKPKVRKALYTLLNNVTKR